MTTGPLLRSALRRSLPALGLLLPAMLHAQLDRSQRPQPAPPPEVHLGEHSTFDLPNGLKVVVVENHKLPLVAVQLRYDVPAVALGEKVGLTDLLGELLAAGTTTRSKAAIDLEVDRLGALFSTNHEGLYIAGVKRHLPAFMALAADIARNATFPDTEYGAAVMRMRSSVKQRRDDPDAIAEVAARAVAFGRTHPYGEVVTERSLAALSAADLRSFHRFFHRPDRACLVLVGDLTAKEAKELARVHFGTWKKPKGAAPDVGTTGMIDVPGLGPLRSPLRPVLPTQKRRVYIVDRPGAPQSVVRVTFPVNLNPKDLRTMEARVMNTILGGGVFNARLMANLREDKGWTYGCYSTLEADRVNGHFTVSVSVRTAATDSAVTEILRELERMRDEPVDARELAIAKNYLAGTFGRDLEDPRTVARFAVNTWLNGLEKDHYATWLKRLEAVDQAAVAAAASAFLRPENAAILVVGDRRAVHERLRPLALDTRDPVLVLDVDAQPWKEVVIPVTDRTAEQVIETHLFASGGRDRIAALHQVLIDEEVEIGGMRLERSRWFGLSDRYREETRAEGKLVSTTIYDGQRAVLRTRDDDQELMDIDLFDLLLNARPVPDTYWKSTAEHIILNGKVKEQEREYYRITIISRAGTSIQDYYDLATGLKVRRMERKFMHGHDLHMTTEYHDYRPGPGGVLFPHHIEQTGGHLGPISIRVKAVHTVSDLPANFFETGLPSLDEEDGDITYPEEDEMKDE